MKQLKLTVAQAERIGSLIVMDDALTKRIIDTAMANPHWDLYVKARSVLNAEQDAIFKAAFK